MRRQQATFAHRRDLSQRRAYALLSAAWSSLGYRSYMDDRDAPLIAAMRELAAQYPRYGYRRIQVFTESQGHGMSPDKAWRLWVKTGLQVPRKRPR